MVTTLDDKQFLFENHAFRKKTKKPLFRFPKFLACHQDQEPPDDHLQTPNQVNAWLADDERCLRKKMPPTPGERANTYTASPGRSVVAITAAIVPNKCYVSQYAATLLDELKGKTVIKKLWTLKWEDYPDVHYNTVAYQAIGQSTQLLSNTEFFCYSPLWLNIEFLGDSAVLRGVKTDNVTEVADISDKTHEVMADMQHHNVKKALRGVWS